MCWKFGTKEKYLFVDGGCEGFHKIVLILFFGLSYDSKIILQYTLTVHLFMCLCKFNVSPSCLRVKFHFSIYQAPNPSYALWALHIHHNTPYSFFFVTYTYFSLLYVCIFICIMYILYSQIIYGFRGRVCCFLQLIFDTLVSFLCIEGFFYLQYIHSFFYIYSLIEDW